MSELFESIYLNCSTDIGKVDDHKDLLEKPLEQDDRMSLHFTEKLNSMTNERLFEEIYRKYDNLPLQ